MDDQARLKDLALSESGFLFDPYSGFTFSVNATGKAILEALRRGASPEAIERELRDHFELGEGDDPGRDLQDYLRALRDNGLLAATKP